MAKPTTTLNPAPKTDAAAKEFVTELRTLNDETVPTLRRDFDALKEKYKALEGVDFGELMKVVDKMKSGYDVIRRRIATNSKIAIAGLDDPQEASKFSLVRAALAVKTKNWQYAGFEKEVFDEARKSVEGSGSLTKAGQVIGVDQQGGYFVPDQVIADVIQAIYTKSTFINLGDDGTTRVSILDGLVGGTTRVPKFDGGMIAYWIGEQQNYVESMVKMGNMSLVPKKLGVLGRLTNEMQRFSGYGFENLFRQDMQRAAAKLLDRTIVYGLGSENTPKGLVQYALATETSPIRVYSAETNAYGYLNPNPTGLTPTQSTQSGAASNAIFNNPCAGGVLNFDGLENMVGAMEDDDVEPNDSFAVVSCGKFFRSLKQLKVQFYNGQTANQAYLLGAPMLSDSRLRDLLGFDYDWTNQISSTNLPGQSIGLTPVNGATNSYADVFAGNWSEMLFGRWSGIEIEDDGGTGNGFINDQTFIKLRMYADVGLRQSRAFIMSPDAKVR